MSEEERRKQAQLIFDLLMEFFTNELKASTELLEKVDEVANYLGDIAKSREND